MVKPPVRTKSIGFKVSEEEYRQLEGAAQASRQTLGEWCRDVAMRATSIQQTGPTEQGAGTQTVMAELMALRAILLNVLFKQVNGQKLSAEEMQRLIDRADSDRLAKGQERLKQADGNLTEKP